MGSISGDGGELDGWIIVLSRFFHGIMIQSHQVYMLDSFIHFNKYN